MIQSQTKLKYEFGLYCLFNLVPKAFITTIQFLIASWAIKNCKPGKAWEQEATVFGDITNVDHVPAQAWSVY